MLAISKFCDTHRPHYILIYSAYGRAEKQLIESFNGKLRDELLNRAIFTTLDEARVLIEYWRREYNQIRSHSALGINHRHLKLY